MNPGKCSKGSEFPQPPRTDTHHVFLSEVRKCFTTENKIKAV